MEASLPRAAYCDADIFAVEQRRALATSWVCVGRTDLVGPTPGSYRLVTVAGEHVLLVRDGAGLLGAFANRCAHRGTELVDSTSQVHVSACFDTVIRCPYHFWAYNLDGTLRAAPWIDDINKAAFGLFQYDLDQWAGFVFVRVDGSAGVDSGTLMDDLGPIADRVGQYPLDALVIGHSITYQVSANWKVIAENYNECYHCGPVHPELCDLVPSFRIRGGGQLAWDDGVPHRSGANTYTMTGTTTRLPFDGLDQAHLDNHFGELIYPNLMLSLSRDHAAAFVLQPTAADQTTIVCDLLFHPTEVARSHFDPADAVDFWHMVNLQDWAICERVQRGMTSASFVHGWYAPMEDPSLDIRRWWHAKMPSDPATPSA